MRKDLLAFLLIVLLSVPVIRSLSLPGFPTTHDGVTHVVRFMKFHQALSEGQFPPRWSDGIAFGLGSPVLMYNSFLPYLSAEIPRFLGAGWAASIEIIFALSLILSGITFYLWAKEIFGRASGFVGAMFYIYAPYRFVDIYVRGAYPESFAFIFPPLLLLSIKKMIDDGRWRWVLLSIFSLSGLILSHNVMAILFVAIGFLYGLILARLSGSFKRIRLLGGSFLAALAITALFWMPAFFEKGAVNLDYLNSTASYLANFVSLKEVAYSRWGWGPLGSDSPMSLQLGITQQAAVLMTVVFSLTAFASRSRIMKRLMRIFAFSRLGLSLSVPKLQISHFLFFFSLLAVSVFLMTAYSQFLWERISLLAFFLYPWRWLTLAVFSSAVLAAFLLFVLRQSKLFKALAVLLVVLLLYSNRNFSQLVGVVKGGEDFYESYRDTTDMWGEFLPRNVDLEMVKRCKEDNCTFPKIVMPVGIDFNISQKMSTRMDIKYTASKDFSSTVNILNFPGWTLYLDGDKRGPLKTDSMGTMDVSLPNGEHQISLVFEDTPLRSISFYLSMGGLILLVGTLWKKRSLF